jgi:hypothetical protein
MKSEIITSMSPDELAELVAAKVIAMLNKKADEPVLRDRWMNIKELRAHLPDHPATQTIYTWTSQNKIPFSKVPGKKGLAFLKSEIDEWLKSGRQKTIAEIRGGK